MTWAWIILSISGAVGLFLSLRWRAQTAHEQRRAAEAIKQRDRHWQIRQRDLLERQRRAH